MAGRHVRFRARATDDVESAVAYYRLEAGEEIALAFVDALEQTINRLRRSPGVGSLRYSYVVDVPDLRALRAGRFPYLVFFMVTADAVDIWRVLHERRDVPSEVADLDPT